MKPENEPLAVEEIQHTGPQEDLPLVSTDDLVARGGIAVRIPLRELEREAYELEQVLQGAEQRNRAVLSTGIPILLVILALEAIIAEVVFTILTGPTGRAYDVSPLFRALLGYNWNLPPGVLQDVLLAALHIFPGWLLTIGIAWSFYYFRVRVPLQAARRNLRDCEDRLQRERLSTAEGRLDYLKEEVRRLSHVTARVFLDNKARYDQAKEWREKAEDILDYGIEGNLGEAQSLISSINELVVREEGELRAQRNWRFAAIAIIVGYIIALVLIAFVNTGYPNAMVPVFGVPLSVAMWAAAGSLAAILYRFYTERKRVRLDLEVRWLIARPVIGIIMGMVSYLAITAGLLLLNAPPATGGEGSAATVRLEVYWVIAFVAGFSDKFYLRIIDLLVERTVGDKDKGEEAGQAGEEAEQEVETEPGGGEDLAANQEDNLGS